MPSIEHFRIMGRAIDFDSSYLRPLAPKEERFPCISSLALDVSGGCNMKCVYCAESMTLPKRIPMDRKILIRSVEMLFQRSQPGSALSIHFGSGEPLLQSGAVKTAGKLAKKLAREQSRPLSLHLTTNGTQLNRRTIQWLVDDAWEVKVSLDGPREVHDQFRRGRNGKGTYARIERDVRTLSSKIPERLSTTSVLCKGTDPAKVFYAIARLGVRRIDLVPAAAPRDSSFLLGEADLNEYRRFTLDYAKKLAKGRGMPVSIRFRKRLQRVLGLGNSQVACGAGRTFFAVGPEGALYPCMRFLGIEKYKLGDIRSGIGQGAVGRFAFGPGRPYPKRKACRRCWAAPLCDGPCFACAELMGGGSPLPGFCEMIRADCEGALWLADVLRAKNPKKLCSLAGINLEI